MLSSSDAASAITAEVEAAVAVAASRGKMAGVRSFNVGKNNIVRETLRDVAGSGV